MTTFIKSGISLVPAWIVLLISISGLFPSLAQGAESTKLVTLPELTHPQSLQMDEEQIYIVQGHEIYIYSRRDYRLLKIFGEAGESPQAFRPRRGRSKLFVHVDSENLSICSHERVSLFSKNGVFIKSEELGPQIDYLFPMGDRFVGSAYYIHVGTGRSTQHIRLYDKQHRIITEIAQSHLGGGSARGFGGPDRKLHYDLTPHLFGFRIFEDRIYVANTHEGFFIEVFDSSGEKLYEIKKDFEKNRITEAYKKKRMEEIREMPSYERHKDFIAIDEADHFPAFRRFTVADGKICVYTSPGHEQEIVVMDLEGEILNRVLVPGSDVSTISNDKYYYLKENDDAELELHVLDIGSGAMND
jgi:hypothetical protein